MASIIREDGTTTTSEAELEEELIHYYRQAFNPNGERPYDPPDTASSFAEHGGLDFTTEEVREAAKACNFSKAIGPDGFDGRIIGTDKQLDEKIFKDIAAAMNSGSIKEFLRHGRLVPLSKTRGANSVRCEEVRPIIVKSHITKIMEKAILARLSSSHEHLLKVGSY